MFVPHRKHICITPLKYEDSCTFTFYGAISVRHAVLIRLASATSQGRHSKRVTLLVPLTGTHVMNGEPTANYGDTSQPAGCPQAPGVRLCSLQLYAVTGLRTHDASDNRFIPHEVDSCGKRTAVTDCLGSAHSSNIIM
jgi:hypothetical protein